MFEVKDSARTLQFNGKLLSESSSWRRDSTRWIEFALYKTDNGSYVLSRIGVSIIYHGAACPLVKRYSLNEVNAIELIDNAIPSRFPANGIHPAFSFGLHFCPVNCFNC